VIGAHGSTPRHLGARMAVAEDGEQWGTIGGGRIEQLVASAAREVAAGAAPRVVRQHLVRDLAMCCGGSMEVVLTPAEPSREVLRELATGPAGVLVTPVDGGALASREATADEPTMHRPNVVDGSGWECRFDPDDLARHIAKLPLRRAGKPEEYAEVIFYLLAGAGYITGQTIVVDGGGAR
jgi:xanthine/CO dehydrogenase XdhC/CoxF family maturation factor